MKQVILLREVTRVIVIVIVKVLLSLTVLVSFTFTILFAVVVCSITSIINPVVFPLESLSL